MNLLKNSATKLLYFFAFALGIIPRAWSSRMADVLGDVWYIVDKRHRKIALRNLSKAYGNEKSDSELRILARHSLRNTVRVIFEIGWSLRLSKEEIMKHCRVHGLAHLRAAHAKGKGVLILTLHFGNWEFLPSSYIFYGYKVSMVYRPLDFEPADKFFLQYRRRFGGNLIPKKNAIRKILHALKQQECVGILLDQDSGLNAGVFADFFGYPACTNKAMALLALRTGAPVIPTYLVRHGMQFHIHIAPEIPVIQSEQKDKDIEANTRQYNQVLENIIRQYPEQWFWVHQRWKTRPAV